MKTIMIVAAGIADIADRCPGGKTPLMQAYIPAMRELAQHGIQGLTPRLSEDIPISVESSLLALLGYDCHKRIPSVSSLCNYALDSSNKGASLKGGYIILPTFSGHGSVITSHLAARGIGKMALLTPVDLYSPGSSHEEIADMVAALAIERSHEDEFVLVYIDFAAQAALEGDYEKKMDEIELIDRAVIAPIADHAWESQEFMAVCVASGFVSCSETRSLVRRSSPVVMYINEYDAAQTGVFDESSAMRGSLRLDTHSDLMRELTGVGPRY